MECIDPEQTLVYLYHWISNRVCADIYGALMIHGGCGTCNGKRFILCGGKGVGKTTLLCQLLFHGVSSQSDDIVFLDDQEAEPYPGKFRIKEGTLALLPHLKPVCRRLKPYPDFSGEKVYFFDPSDAGFKEPITKGKVDVFIYLTSDRGEKTEINPCPKFMMVQNILTMTLNLEQDARFQIRSLCRAVDAGRCYTLQIKSIEQAVGMVKKVLS